MLALQARGHAGQVGATASLWKIPTNHIHGAAFALPWVRQSRAKQLCSGARKKGLAMSDEPTPGTYGYLWAVLKSKKYTGESPLDGTFGTTTFGIC